MYFSINMDNITGITRRDNKIRCELTLTISHYQTSIHIPLVLLVSAIVKKELKNARRSNSFNICSFNEFPTRTSQITERTTHKFHSSDNGRIANFTTAKRKFYRHM